MSPGLTDGDAEAVRKWLDEHQFEHLVSSGGNSAGFVDSQDIWARKGTLVRLTRSRGQWSYDLSRAAFTVWLDIDRLAGALGIESTLPVDRVAELATSMNDRMFGALSNTLPHTP